MAGAPSHLPNLPAISPPYLHVFSTPSPRHLNTTSTPRQALGDALIRSPTAQLGELSCDAFGLHALGAAHTFSISSALSAPAATLLAGVLRANGRVEVRTKLPCPLIHSGPSRLPCPLIHSHRHPCPSHSQALSFEGSHQGMRSNDDGVLTLPLHQLLGKVVVKYATAPSTASLPQHPFQSTPSTASLPKHPFHSASPQLPFHSTFLHGVERACRYDPEMEH